MEPVDVVLRKEPSPLVLAMKQPGIEDLKGKGGMKCCAAFARAWMAEQEAGHTTPEAEQYLEEAIKLESEYLGAKK